MYDKNPAPSTVSQKGNVMAQASSGWLPSGTAGFRCLNNVVAFDPSFCLSTLPNFTKALTTYVI